ncbi:uncharacterized protein RSE6_11708 [Rhynchosporium secalis]|uniref:Uncharacterized protein n=1 Tax=Rhynchosporium secalis TaxID=38038 RepID=A0A1E1MNN6_RHYSE|nr:uncharacterized protein RSE6_11708 [Rhynchosporium secalis]
MSSWNDDYLNVYPPTSRMYTLTMSLSSIAISMVAQVIEKFLKRLR